MNTATSNKTMLVSVWFSTLQVPFFTLLIASSLLAIFSLSAYPLLHEILPFEAWPPLAQWIHWTSPWMGAIIWLAATASLSAVVLGFGGLDGVVGQFFTGRRKLISTLVWFAIYLFLTSLSLMPLSVRLFRG